MVGHVSNTHKRGKTMKRALAVVVLLTVLVPATLWAQADGPTLEGLAETVAELVTRMDFVEGKFLHDATVTEMGNCRLALPGRLHATSLISYMEKYTDAETPDTEILAVYHLVEHEDSGATAIIFGVDGDYPIKHRIVSEHWMGCEFLSSSEWHSLTHSGEYVDE